jgi:hypothetical protein
MMNLESAALALVAANHVVDVTIAEMHVTPLTFAQVRHSEADPGSDP